MGKKIGKKRLRDEEDNEDVQLDPELSAELAALQAIRNEKEGKQQTVTFEDQVQIKPKSVYNKEGLIKSLENIPTASLSFIESMQLSDFVLDVQDEHDDLQREVTLLLFYHQF